MYRRVPNFIVADVQQQRRVSHTKERRAALLKKPKDAPPGKARAEGGSGWEGVGSAVSSDTVMYISTSVSRSLPRSRSKSAHMPTYSAMYTHTHTHTCIIHTQDTVTVTSRLGRMREEHERQARAQEIAAYAHLHVVSGHRAYGDTSAMITQALLLSRRRTCDHAGSVRLTQPACCVRPAALGGGMAALSDRTTRGGLLHGGFRPSAIFMHTCISSLSLSLSLSLAHTKLTHSLSISIGGTRSRAQTH